MSSSGGVIDGGDNVDVKLQAGECVFKSSSLSLEAQARLGAILDQINSEPRPDEGC